MSLKIVQVAGWFFPDGKAGTEIYVQALSAWLKQRGHEVTIAAPDAEASDERTYVHNGFEVYRYPIPPRLNREQAQGRAEIPGTAKFHRWMRLHRPDVVHFHTFTTGLSLPEVRAAAATGAKIIATNHLGSLGYLCQRGTLMLWGREPCDGKVEVRRCASCELQNRGLNPKLASVFAAVPPSLGRVLRRFPGKLSTAASMSALIADNLVRQHSLVNILDNFVLLTSGAREIALANGLPADKLVVNRLGVAYQNQRKPSPEEQPTKLPLRIGYVGRFDAIKGVHDLARAAASLPLELRFQLEFRGFMDSPGADRVIQELKDISGEDPRITFLPEVEAVAVPSLLAEYDILCCPSVCYEGGPTVAIEAHSVGTPVIGTRIGALPDLITDGANGRLVAPGDWQSLATALRDAISDPANTVDQWRRNLPPARTMDEIAAAYLNLYQG